ncbi:MAG: cytochrome C [Oligoflexia bacterium]|nr:cytochrome C [Oligoflexia bacterium]
MLNIRPGLCILALMLTLNAAVLRADEAALIQRGKYLTLIGGCNDCHTPGFPESGGSIPEDQWLTGVPLGWNGPWGTTYAVNLRLLLTSMTEERWLKFAHEIKARPPMPSWALNAMPEEDLRAIFKFVNKLGPGGSVMPPYTPPGDLPKTAYIEFVPKSPKP